jgi:hypothetical protein
MRLKKLWLPGIALLTFSLLPACASDQGSEHQHHEAEHGANHQHEQSPHTGVEHGHGKLEYQFSPEDEVKANQPTKLTVSVFDKDKKPLGGAVVKFEYWKSDEEKHQFVDAAEESTGTYAANSTFPSAGEYTLVVHVEGRDIHDHHELKLSVK